MMVREMLTRIDAMVRDCPGLIDSEVCTYDDEFGSWGETDSEEDVNVIEFKETGSRFLGIGPKPSKADYEPYRVAWPEVSCENRMHEH